MESSKLKLNQFQWLPEMTIVSWKSKFWWWWLSTKLVWFWIKFNQIDFLSATILQQTQVLKPKVWEKKRKEIKNSKFQSLLKYDYYYLMMTDKLHSEIT